MNEREFERLMEVLDRIAVGLERLAPIYVMQAPATPIYPSAGGNGGYTCTKCWGWINPGVHHICGSQSGSIPAGSGG